MSVALYRRYRPEAFDDVIGQEHVTGPLMQALRAGRVNHAYLFSGPRGCGKTTSARILARCLNCEQGPTPTPCGTCRSCVALARGGPGTVDVIEIDAASHGGVEDARDLRERASYGPAESRYKVYIIDEAHMVTPQGFNALLKIVEEPPEHVKFVFATTEPEKVIGTIRSRTHHYPFRLVPPAKLTTYLESLCEAEGVAVEPGVMSFVTRAGGGSVRDSLSVLDQLVAGSGDEGITYAGAAALLGFTSDELLDGIVEALAARDAAGVFQQVDKVVESGHDPRRFVEDLLTRLRDLIVVAAVRDGAEAVLPGRSSDQIERLRHQAGVWGMDSLTRAAEVVNAGLSQMGGATAERLVLELICARVLLPGAAGEDGYGSRLDRIERRLEAAGAPAPAAPAASVPSAASSSGADEAANPSTASAAATDSAGGQQSTGGRRRAERAVAHSRAAQAERAARESDSAQGQEQGPAQHGAANGEASTPDTPDSRATEPQPEDGGPQGARQDQQHPPAQDGPAAEPRGGGRDRAAETPRQGSARGAQAAPQAPSEPARPAATPGAMDTEAVRRAWPDVLRGVSKISRVTWSLLSEHSHVLNFDGRVLTLGIRHEALARRFATRNHQEVVRQALSEHLGLNATVEARTDDGSGGGGAQPSQGGGPGPAGPGASDQGPAGGGPGAPGPARPRPADPGTAGPGSADSEPPGQQPSASAEPAAEPSAQQSNDHSRSDQHGQNAEAGDAGPGAGLPSYNAAAASEPPPWEANTSEPPPFATPEPQGAPSSEDAGAGDHEPPPFTPTDNPDPGEQKPNESSAAPSAAGQTPTATAEGDDGDSAQAEVAPTPPRARTAPQGELRRADRVRAMMRRREHAGARKTQASNNEPASPEEPDLDDLTDVEDAGPAGREVIASILGGTVIAETEE